MDECDGTAFGLYLTPIQTESNCDFELKFIMQKKKQKTTTEIKKRNERGRRNRFQNDNSIPFELNITIKMVRKAPTLRISKLVLNNSLIEFGVKEHQNESDRIDRVNLWNAKTRKKY